MLDCNASCRQWCTTLFTFKPATCFGAMASANFKPASSCMLLPIDASCMHQGALSSALAFQSLQEKMAARSEGVSARRSHLTVALSQCNGSSPGAPVILEILPAGHSSAPHDNANAYGVLRLLHGSMEGQPLPCLPPA